MSVNKDLPPLLQARRLILAPAPATLSLDLLIFHYVILHSARYTERAGLYCRPQYSTIRQRYLDNLEAE
jgi:hypothetical protein